MTTQTLEHPWTEYAKLMTAIDPSRSKDEAERMALDAWGRCFGVRGEHLVGAVMHAQTCDQCVQAYNAYDEHAKDRDS